MLMTRWEDRPEIKADPKQVEDFKAAFNDHSLSYVLIAANFGMSTTSVSAVAGRLGCPPRPGNSKKMGPRPSNGTSVTVIEGQITELEGQLASLRKKKLDLTIRATRQGSTITTYGFLNDPLTLSVEDWVEWLRAGGPAKVRALIEEDEWGR